MRWTTWTLALALAAAPSACGDTSQCHDVGCVEATAASATTGAGAAGGASLAQQYCDCMLLSCHDAYHASFGPDSDEPAARANCLAEAEALPAAGMPIEEGNFVECRIHFCEAGQSDESVCPSAVGAAPCSE
jgi:hypothetical protein